MLGMAITGVYEGAFSAFSAFSERSLPVTERQRRNLAKVCGLVLSAWSLSSFRPFRLIGSIGHATYMCMVTPTCRFASLLSQ